MSWAYKQQARCWAPRKAPRPPPADPPRPKKWPKNQAPATLRVRAARRIGKAPQSKKRQRVTSLVLKAASPRLHVLGTLAAAQREACVRARARARLELARLRGGPPPGARRVLNF